MNSKTAQPLYDETESQDSLDFTTLRVKKIAWYIRHRAKIWGTIFFIIGVFGGDAGIIKDYTDTKASIDNSTNNSIEQKLDNIEQKLDEISNFFKG